jgi:hypothetical protein
VQRCWRNDIFRRAAEAAWQGSLALPTCCATSTAFQLFLAIRRWFGGDRSRVGCRRRIAGRVTTEWLGALNAEIGIESSSRIAHTELAAETQTPRTGIA